MSWIPLNVHSQFSILDSTASVVQLAEKAASYSMPALALTDQGNLYGAIDFYKACQAAKIKPILGCELAMAPNSRLEKKKEFGAPVAMPITLLAASKTGYQNLCKLSSIGFLEGFYYQPRIDKESLAAHAEGLICLSGPVEGPIGRQILEGSPESLLQELDWYRSIFKENFYLEIQRFPLRGEAKAAIQEGWLLQSLEAYAEKVEKTSHRLIDISQKFSISLVATNPIRYIDPEDWQAHEILLNIQSGEPCEIWERDSAGNPKNKAPNPKRSLAPTREMFFKTPEAMQALFSDIPQAVEETVRIADRCRCELDFKTKHYPVFIPPGLEGKKVSKAERLKEAENFLRKLCLQGIEERYTPDKLAALQKKVAGRDPKQAILDRCLYEFEILTSKGMCDYMLIVYDFIAWAKKKNIPMGPGRGSAAGSLVSYLIGITDIEPLRFDLFFERFINPERVSYPDIDVDICMDRRQEVIDYVVAKYGKDKVAQIITFGTMKAKMAIRDVGRVLNVPLSKVNEIAALIPEDPTMTLDKAFQIDPQLSALMESDEEARRVLTMAKKAEGSIRNTSTHAAGLIISAHPITDHIPVCVAKDSDMVVTQYAMKPVESVGMLKIDFLGLKTLTSIQKCADAVERRTGKKIDWVNLALNDQKTFDLLNQGKTLGVFQLESGGMQDLTKQLRIDVFEEVIAVCALYRPGPMDMIPSFINRKHGREPIEIDHPFMKEILSETYGVMVYQEQVMQIASALAGYSLGEGDVLRRAMGKKDKEEMARQREKFLAGSEKKGIDNETAARIFDKIEKFASYGFNKSHAAAYAYLSYATGFFKANYPKEWMAALMTCDLDDLTKVAKFIGEAKSMHIAALPPDINTADSEFAATEEGIRFAMSGIKGIGSALVIHILEERKKGGAFQNLYDFIRRTDKTKIGKKQIELLCEAGCFDFTGWSRDQLKASVDPMYAAALRDQKESSKGILDLFSGMEQKTDSFSHPPFIKEPTSATLTLQKEKELLGFFLTGHPMDLYKNILSRLSCVPFSEIERLADGAIFRAAFIIDAIAVKISSKNQKKFAILTISDGLDRFELPVWSDLFENKAAILKENQLIYAILQLERKDNGVHLSCKALENLAALDETKIKILDDLYDRLKIQTKAIESKWKAKSQAGAAVIEETKHILIQLDADTTRLSTILALKDLFRENPGKSTLELQFFSGKETKVGTVSIDAQWGVNPNPSFLEKLGTFPLRRFSVT